MAPPAEVTLPMLEQLHCKSLFSLEVVDDDPQPSLSLSLSESELLETSASQALTATTNTHTRRGTNRNTAVQLLVLPVLA